MLARTTAAVLLAFACLNMGLYWLVQSHAIALQPLDIQTRPVYQVRLEEFFAKAEAPRAVFLGDSLVFGGQLRDKLGDAWARGTLPARFAEIGRHERGGRYDVLNLGVNGVLFSELRCMARDVLARRPTLLVVNVSPRPFSEDFRVPAAETERSFLCPARSSSAAARAREGVQDALGRILPVLRYRDLLQFSWLSSTPRGWLLQSADSWLSRSGQDEQEPLDPDDAEAAEVMRDMVWRTKAANRYNAIRVTSDHPQAAELTALLTMLAAAQDTQVVVFYLRENVGMLEGQLDLAHYEQQSSKFVDSVKRSVEGTRVHFVVVPSLPFSERYTDHIHLDAQGYAMLARTLNDVVR